LSKETAKCAELKKRKEHNRMKGGLIKALLRIIKPREGFEIVSFGPIMRVRELIKK
jgi:hypothetical protein